MLVELMSNEFRKRTLQYWLDEFGNSNVPVGPINTIETVLTNETVHDAMVESTPLKRLGEPEDMALGALYLASPASAYVTGTVLEIHGGLRTANLDLDLMKG